jgi:TPP-dependent pyruvate/acetoin dehydrogenase alpha subunit
MSYEFRLNVFKRASLCRNFEEETYKQASKGLFKSPIYLSAGQEFAAATLAEIYKDEKPLLFAQHRAHSTYLSFGGDPVKLIDELLGKDTGCASGMAGSPSIQCKEINMYGHDGFIGTEVGIAVGACFASKKFTIAFMGDAAAEEDYVLTALGWAATKKLPILFVVEDNDLSILTKKQVRRSWDIVDVADAFGLAAVELEDDPVMIEKYLSLDRRLPMLVNIHTERLYWHAGAGTDPYEKRDRYLIEKTALGLDAECIHANTKAYVESLWKERLEKQ